MHTLNQKLAIQSPIATSIRPVNFYSLIPEILTQSPYLLRKDMPCGVDYRPCCSEPSGFHVCIHGMDESTHMLCVVSKNTVKSYWVPFEVGYSYERIPLAILTLRGIPDELLPDYMKTTEVVRGTLSLNEFISKLLGQDIETLARWGAIKKHFERHPLDNILDWSK